MLKEVENLALLEPCVEKVSSRNKKSQFQIMDGTGV